MASWASCLRFFAVPVIRLWYTFDRQHSQASSDAYGRRRLDGLPQRHTAARLSHLLRHGRVGSTDAPREAMPESIRVCVRLGDLRLKLADLLGSRCDGAGRLPEITGSARHLIQPSEDLTWCLELPA